MKKENGITMIALIITIIVMVILAGAAITMVVGDDAVIRKSKSSVAEQNIAQAQEEVGAAWAELEMGFWMDTTDETRTSYFTAANLETALAGKGTISELNYVPGGTTTGKYVKDGEEYEFTLDTTNHTDVTADSFGTTSGGYGEGADIVPESPTEPEEIVTTVSITDATTDSRFINTDATGNFTLTTTVEKSDSSETLTFRYRIYKGGFGTDYIGSSYDLTQTTTSTLSTVTGSLDNLVANFSEGVYFYVVVDVLDLNGNVKATKNITEEYYFTMRICCFPAETMVSVVVEEEDENGKKTKKLKKKKIKDLTYDDDLLVWDFDKGCLAIAKPLWLKKSEEIDEVNVLKFSDGTELKTVKQHRIFNKELGKFTYPMSDETPIGTTTFKEDGTEVTLVSKEVVTENVEYYNVITNYHMNAFAEGILTSCRLSNLYEIKDMKYVKDDRELVSIEEFGEIPEEFYKGLRLAEQPKEINRGNSDNHGDSYREYVMNCIGNQQV